MLAHIALRATTLVNYTAFKTYQVVHLKGKMHAGEIGQMEYRAPDRKKFVVASEKGSVVVRRLALHSIIASEIETTADKQHPDSAISPANYALDLLGEQQVGPHHYLIAQAIPNGTISICSQAGYESIQTSMRLSGLKAIRQSTSLSGSKGQTLCANTRRSLTSGFRKKI